MFCLHCGKEIPDASTFCMACGKAITVAKRRPIPWSAILGTATAALLVGGVLTIGLKNYADKRSNPTPTRVESPTSISTSDRPSALKTLESVLQPKLTPGEISLKFSRSVVTILKRGEDGQRAGQGSGFILARDLVLTNYHVIRGASGAQVATTNVDTIEVDSVMAFN